MNLNKYTHSDQRTIYKMKELIVLFLLVILSCPILSQEEHQKTRDLPTIDSLPGSEDNLCKQSGFENIIGISGFISPLYVLGDALQHERRIKQSYGAGLHWIGGYRFDRKYFIGAGVSYERYGNSSNALPVLFDVQISFRDMNVSPIFSFSGGYAFSWSDKQLGMFNGGVLLMPSLGSRICFAKQTGMIIRFAYKVQQMSVFSHYRYFYLTPEAVHERKWLHMICLRVEFVF